MERKRKRRPGLVGRMATRIARAARWCASQAQRAWHAVGSRLRPWNPTVVVDARRGRARRLRRMLRRATRMQCQALGVPPPDHLLVVVQRTVVDGDRQLAALLQVFEDADGTRRHVLFLALSVGEETVSDGAIVALLRQQLHAVVGDALGALVSAVPCAAPQFRRPATVVPLRPQEATVTPFEDAPPIDDAWAPAPAPTHDSAYDGAYAVAAER